MVCAIISRVTTLNYEKDKGTKLGLWVASAPASCCCYFSWPATLNCELTWFLFFLRLLFSLLYHNKRKRMKAADYSDCCLQLYAVLDLPLLLLWLVIPAIFWGFFWLEYTGNFMLSVSIILRLRYTEQRESPNNLPLRSSWIQGSC